MGPPDLLNIRWNSFEANTRIVFQKLRDEREFYDVTVVADCGRQVEANKVVLASGSSFFHKIIKENPHPHPLIYLKGVGYEHLSGILDIVYTGETSISQDDLNEFLDIAQDLKVKAFEEKNATTKQTKSSSTSPVPLHGVDSDKEACPSPEASHPHCVASPTSAPHKAPIGAREDGLSSRISREDGLSSRISREDGLSSRISREDGLSSRISLEAGLLPRIVISSISQGEEVKEEASPLHSKSATSQGPKVADEAAPSLRMFHPHTVTSLHQSEEEAQNDTAFGVFKNGQSPPDWYEVGEENDNMIQTEEQETYIEIDNNKNNAHDWGGRNQDDGNMSHGEQDLNEKVNSSEEKYFQCSLCIKTFNNLTNLKRHKMIHTVKKPSRLKRIHVGVKPYKCSVCFKRFSYVKDLNKHNRVHTGETPYQCMQCSKSFYQESNLNKHKKTHTGEKPFQCMRCFNRFSQKACLQKHMKRKICSANARKRNFISAEF